MASHKEHSIDRLFRKGLESYKEKAPEYSWEAISGELRDQKRVRYLRMTKYAAAVVAILLAFYFGNRFSSLEMTDQSQLARQETSPSVTEKQTLNRTEATYSKLNSLNVRSISLKNPAQKITQRNELPGSTLLYSLSDRSEDMVSELATYDAGLLKINPEEKLDLPDHYWENLLNNTGNRLLAYGNGGKAQKKNSSKSQKGWSLGGSFAPTYSYRTTDNDKLNLFNNSLETSKDDPSSYEQALVTYSTGINAQYAMNDNWQFETGLYYSRLGHQKEALFVKNNDLDNGGLYHLNTSAGKVDGSRVPDNIITEIEGSHKPGENPDDFTANTSEDAKLFQRFDYVEIPMIAKYKIYDKKIDVNIIGGLSTGLLVNNETVIETPGQRENLGDTKNIRQVLNSSLVGLGFRFNLSKDLTLDLEPTFKYGLHSINESNEFGYKPYSLGVYSGVSYRF